MVGNSSINLLFSITSRDLSLTSITIPRHSIFTFWCLSHWRFPGGFFWGRVSFLPDHGIREAERPPLPCEGFPSSVSRSPGFSFLFLYLNLRLTFFRRCL